MSLTIAVPNRLELAELYDWLRHDPRIARNVTVSMASSGQATGEQGALDVIDVILKDATGIAGLAVSIASFRLARRRDLAVTLRQDGQEVTADTSSSENLEKTIRGLAPSTDAPDAGEDNAGGDDAGGDDAGEDQPRLGPSR